MNYESNTPIKSSFRVEKLTKYHLKRQQKSLKRAQILRKPWDSNLLLSTIEIYIWIHQNQKVIKIIRLQNLVFGWEN